MEQRPNISDSKNSPRIDQLGIHKTSFIPVTLMFSVVGSCINTGDSLPLPLTLFVSRRHKELSK